MVDIIQALIQQPDYQAARNYCKVLKNRLKKEGSQSVTKCHRLKMEAADGKMGGGIAKTARLELEAKTGKRVITAENDLSPAKTTKRIKQKNDHDGNVTDDRPPAEGRRRLRFLPGEF